MTHIPTSHRDPIAYWTTNVPTHERTSEYWPTTRGDSTYLFHHAPVYRSDYPNGTVQYWTRSAT